MIVAFGVVTVALRVNYHCGFRIVVKSSESPQRLAPAREENFSDSVGSRLAKRRGPRRLQRRARPDSEPYPDPKGTVGSVRRCRLSHDMTAEKNRDTSGRFRKSDKAYIFAACRSLTRNISRCQVPKFLISTWAFGRFKLILLATVSRTLPAHQCPGFPEKKSAVTRINQELSRSPAFPKRSSLKPKQRDVDEYSNRFCCTLLA